MISPPPTTLYLNSFTVLLLFTAKSWILKAISYEGSNKVQLGAYRIALDGKKMTKLRTAIFVTSIGILITLHFSFVYFSS